MKKHFAHILHIGACIAMVGIVYFAFLKNTGTKEIDVWETKIDEQPPVSIAITPRTLGKNADTWEFNIVFDTHSGSLDEDPMEVIVLSDKGKEYKPASWEGPGPGGHHREGALVFDAVKGAASVELKVKNIGGIPGRVFQWKF